MRDTRLKESEKLNIEGMWRGEGKRSTSSQTHHRQSSRELPSLSSSKLQRDARKRETQGLRKVKRSRLKEREEEHFIPNANAREER
jgi:hypothetical protein